MNSIDKTGSKDAVERALEEANASLREADQRKNDFLAVLSHELRNPLSPIQREQSVMLLLGGMNAEGRLAAFLLNLSQRYAARGYSPREFYLRMGRTDIGSYLGMKIETVSRTFSSFQKQRLLEVDKRHIRITDLEGLQRLFEAGTV